jgi:hypothetical protein
MAEQTHITQDDYPFGIVHLLVLGTLLVVGMFLAVPLVKAGEGAVSLGAQWSGIAAIGGWLWPIEAVLYLIISAVLSRGRSVGVVVGGAMLGVVTRLVASLLIAVAVGTASNMPVPVTFLEHETGLWAYHALAIVIATAALFLSYGGLIRAGFRGPERVVVPDAHAGANFSFAARPAPSATPQGKGGIGQLKRVDTARDLAPPDGFVPVTPAPNVFGAVHITGALVLECIPEAAPHVTPEQRVPIRLALIVPQLAHGTVWVTWQQVSARPDEPGASEASRPDAGIMGRWVRIPAHAYVMQVPHEHFQVSRPKPAWMTATPVPQEDQFPAPQHQVTERAHGIH